MLTTLKLLMMIFIHGGSISLEHLAGDQASAEKWCIWMSAFIKWLSLDPQISTVTFLQGPLGQRFAKPTTMLIGRMPTFAQMVFAQYERGWRATEILSGREGKGWKTSKAKAYPTKLCMVIASSHLQHYASLAFDGEEKEPEEMQELLSKLAQVHDPYNLNAVGITMKADYHARPI